MAQLLPCIDGVVADLDGDGYSLSHVTGHSLGGAAATIYEALYDTGGLVTFGAPPTALPDYDKDKTFLKGEFNIKINDYETYNYKSLSLVDTGEELKIEGAAVGPSNPEGMVDGTRYFHKFDPVPGFYQNSMIWGHQVTKGGGAISGAIMLYDTEDAACTGGSFSAKSNYAGGDLSNLYSHLCTGSGVATNSWEADDDYYSYTNMFNPAPCAEAAAGWTVVYLQVTGVDVSDVDGIWVPHESALQCTQTFIATLEAYSATDFTSALWGQTDIEQRNPLFWLSFFSMWAIWSVHSSYPNYDLEDFGGSLSYEEPDFSTFTGKVDKDLTVFADKVMGTSLKNVGESTTVADMVAMVSD